MRSRRWVAVLGGVACLSLAAPRHAPADAAPGEGLVRLAAGGLQVSAPASASLGSGSAGQTISGQLGPVTVSASSAVLAGWSATVSLTGGFTVNQSGQSWTFPASRVRYWSGPATALSGIGLNVCLPAQPAAVNAQTLTGTRTAYSCGAIASLSSSLTWNPTVVVTTQGSDPAGTYSGTITHSVS